MTSNMRRTIRDVIEGEYCIGCGVCTLLAPSIRITFNEYGDLVATLPAEISDADFIEASTVCPFVPGANEIEIARQLFRTADASLHD